MNMIKVAKLGSKVVEVSVESGATVQDALTISGASYEGCTVKLNGTEASDFNTEVEDGDIITIINKIKGGC